MAQDDPSVALFEIHGFESPGEYERFLRWLNELVIAGACEELGSNSAEKVSASLGGRSYRFHTGEVWRLDPPDFPFRGTWLRAA